MLKPARFDPPDQFVMPGAVQRYVVHGSGLRPRPRVTLDRLWSRWCVDVDYGAAAMIAHPLGIFWRQRRRAVAALEARFAGDADMGA